MIKQIQENGNFLMEGAFADRDMRPGETAYTLMITDDKFSESRSRWTIQINEDTHFIPTGEPAFVNHSCNPNLRLVVQNDRLVMATTRDVLQDEELTFNYLTSEAEMAETFDCRCGSHCCFGRVAGFQDLTPEQQKVLLAQGFVLDHLKQM